MNNSDSLDWLLQNELNQCDQSAAISINGALPPLDDDLIQLLLGDNNTPCPVSNIDPVNSTSPPSLSPTTEMPFDAPSHSNEQTISETELKLMTSKERRQLRNKISARNFRNRRKEYMSALETQVEKYKTENSQLKLEIKWIRSTMERMQKENDQLRLDLILARGGLQSGHNISSTYSCPSSSDCSNVASSPETVITTRNTYLAHATVPDWDVYRIVKETSALPANDLLSRYPLLAPALMSIVLEQTIAMAADEFLANAKLNTSMRSLEGYMLGQIMSGPKLGVNKRFVCSEKDIRALWMPPLQKESASVSTSTLSSQSSLASQQQKLITIFTEPEVGWIRAHCPFYLLQRQFCRFIISYVIVRYPQLEIPARTYLPICEQFRHRIVVA
ncbi:hypothetical protein EC973_000451 [Apophysomyces ossiformis]|uniref:BZIP domain-containing protein n=1 Tax=Apophysomyces ossiformis TaxID=679940 RepID=A0A8H7ENT2_9FUNG|nr:hypothetical protein EC973_000451 [Apophysomyces ossiformis]